MKALAHCWHNSGPTIILVGRHLTNSPWLGKTAQIWICKLNHNWFKQDIFTTKMEEKMFVIGGHFVTSSMCSTWVDSPCLHVPRDRRVPPQSWCPRSVRSCHRNTLPGRGWPMGGRQGSRFSLCDLGGISKNTYELSNLRALKISTLYKNLIFQSKGKIFCVEFQRFPLKFHTKYLTHTLKDVHFI